MFFFYVLLYEETIGYTVRPISPALTYLNAPVVAHSTQCFHILYAVAIYTRFVTQCYLPTRDTLTF